MPELATFTAAMSVSVTAKPKPKLHADPTLFCPATTTISASTKDFLASIHNSDGGFRLNASTLDSLPQHVENPCIKKSNISNNTNRKESPSQEPSLQLIQIIDPKKAQNLSILLRALNVTTEEVVDALKEGSEIPVELIQTLIKMAPSSDEELKLRLFEGKTAQLGPAERFLKFLVDIPLAFKRLESLYLMFTALEAPRT